MDREALAALEKRVETMRVVAAEKAVLARSLSYGDPPRWHAEISTAILAIVVLLVFLAGREAGILVASGEPCAGVGHGQYVYIAYATGTYDVVMDTSGNLWMGQRWKKRIKADVVRDIADRLAQGCFFEHQPAYAPSSTWSTLSLRVGNRGVQYRYMSGGPMPLCNTHDDIAQIERAIRNVADGQAD